MNFMAGRGPLTLGKSVALTRLCDLPAMLRVVHQYLPIDSLGHRERVRLGSAQFMQQRSVGQGTHARLLVGQGLDAARRRMKT
jgi:hypothetical protein